MQMPPQLQGFYQPTSTDFGWTGNAYHQPSYEASMPPISALLMREADAWRALLSLHTGVLGTARQMASAVNEDSVTLDSIRESIENREAAYYASLSQLAAHCDQLSTEALRLRTLRKARASTDSQALQALMQAHSSETLAIGATLATNSSSNVSSVTVEMRQASQATRQQIAQVRALLQQVQNMPTLRGKLFVTLDPGDAGEGETAQRTFTPDEVFSAIYAAGSELSDESLTQAINQLCLGKQCEGAPVVAAPPRVTVRRSSDRSGSGCKP